MCNICVFLTGDYEQNNILEYGALCLIEVYECYDQRYYLYHHCACCLVGLLFVSQLVGGTSLRNVCTRLPHYILAVYITHL
jgi:hypothetical protein